MRIASRISVPCPRSNGYDGVPSPKLACNATTLGFCAAECITRNRSRNSIEVVSATSVLISLVRRLSNSEVALARCSITLRFSNGSTSTRRFHFLLSLAALTNVDNGDGPRFSSPRT